MSSFPQHVENIEALKEMGFDVSDCFDDDEVSMESWDYDALTYLVADIVQRLQKDGFRLKTNNTTDN